MSCIREKRNFLDMHWDYIDTYLFHENPFHTRT